MPSTVVLVASTSITELDPTVAVAEGVAAGVNEALAGRVRTPLMLNRRLPPSSARSVV